MLRRFTVIIALLSLQCLPAVALAKSSSHKSINRDHAVCARPSSKTGQCFATIWARSNGSVSPSSTPSGYGPTQLRAAYQITATGSGGEIAIVDADGDPNALADLTTYSQKFNLPVLPTCTTSAQASCFEKLDQTGGQNYPRANSGWELETALDLEASHAMCPGCRLELVESRTAAISDLMAAVDEAVATGAPVVSMSWGGSETSSETTLDKHFNHPGVTFMASSGDSGYGTSWPTASPYVTSVGGTHLVATSNGRTSETAWTDSGSGCSRYESKPSWQHDTACAHRSIADVSADADPSTGAAVYASHSSEGAGWFVVGGTSLSSPLLAGMAADAGVTGQSATMKALYASLGTSRLFDVISGKTGNCSTYLCKAGTGYDGPSGVGTLNGLSAL
jgi:subtilase family serine protease